MTAVVILGTIGAYVVRRKMGNSGIETPFIGLAFWILLTVFFLGRLTSAKPETPDNNAEISGDKNINAAPSFRKSL